MDWVWRLVKRTFDWLWLEEVMDDGFNAWGLDCMVDAMGQVFEYDPPRKVWVFGLEFGTLVANPTTDIYKNRTFGIPASSVLLNGIHREPGRHVLTPGGHVGIEGVPLLRHLREELKYCFCGLICILEDCVLVVCDIFEACFS